VIDTVNRTKQKATEKIKPKIVREPITSEWYYIIKWLALICMAADHIRHLPIDWKDETFLGLFMVGRMAFPLFAWELSECFHFTKHRVKHLLSIGILALVSEIPYDKAIKSGWFDWNWQNVCFMFLLSWLMLMALHADWSKLYEKCGLKVKGVVKFSSKLTGLGITALLFVAAEKLHVDYIYYGMALVMLFDFARNRKFRKLWEFAAVTAFIGSAGSGLTECYLTCYFSLALIWWAEWDAKHPQKKRELTSRILLSKPGKLICRYFYPAHLIILTITALVMNGVAK
jgi:hypothetical protein